MFALRHDVRALVVVPCRHGQWAEVLVCETVKLRLFYRLFGSVHFGSRPCQAGTAERLRAEQQARLSRQAQLPPLAQQLQPRFLFNARNTVSALIRTDPNLAEALLTCLATLLRAAADAGQRSKQSLADELVLFEACAEIAPQRFADRVLASWQTDPATRTCVVPILGLQPRLKNSIRQVVERRRGPTHIAVRGAVRGRDLVHRGGRRWPGKQQHAGAGRWR